MVAECLGKLTLINPTSLLPQLKESLDSNSALMRQTVLTAVKFTICDQVCSFFQLVNFFITYHYSIMVDTCKVICMRLLSPFIL